MENNSPSSKIKSNDDLNNAASSSANKLVSSNESNKEITPIDKADLKPIPQSQSSSVPKKKDKPPKLEDKPFDEFINNHLIPVLKTSIQEKGTDVNEIKLIEGNRPVVGGNCWMVFCELSDQRKFWLCFNEEMITSSKTILLAESNSDPSIVESFLIDEKKTTLPLLISRVLQRLNGQKWIGAN